MRTLEEEMKDVAYKEAEKIVRGLLQPVSHALNEADLRYEYVKFRDGSMQVSVMLGELWDGLRSVVQQRVLNKMIQELAQQSLPKGKGG